jgi:HPt (histidine-containing phosphotransfer) domain-containing protein
MSLDWSTLNSYRDFMGEDADSFIEDIIRSYLSDAPRLLDTLKETITSGDAARFVRSAHTLKSNSATLGATQLASMAAELEQSGKTTPLTELADKVSTAGEELERVLQALKDYLNGG